MSTFNDIPDEASPALGDKVLTARGTATGAERKPTWQGIRNLFQSYFNTVYAAIAHTHVADNISNASAVGKSVLTAVDAATARAALGVTTGGSFSGDYNDLTNQPTLGTAAAKNVGTTAGDVAAGNAPAAAQTAAINTAAADATAKANAAQVAAIAASQPADVDLAAIALLTTTAFGRSFLTQVDAATMRATIGAGTGNGDVTAAAAFGVDTSVLVADGTGKGAKASPVKIDAGGNVTGINSLTVTTFTFTNVVGTVGTANGGTGANTPQAANLALTVAAATIGGGNVIDGTASNSHKRTLAANTTFTLSIADGQTLVVAITGVAAQTYTAAFTGVTWPDATAPTQTAGAKTDVYTFHKQGSVIYGSVVQNF